MQLYRGPCASQCAKGNLAVALCSREDVDEAFALASLQWFLCAIDYYRAGLPAGCVHGVSRLFTGLWLIFGEDHWHEVSVMQLRVNDSYNRNVHVSGSVVQVCLRCLVLAAACIHIP